MTFRRRLVLVLLGIVLIAGSAGYWWWSGERGLTLGKRAIQRSEWNQARAHLVSYLGWHPDHAEAHLLLAEALVRDDSREAKESAVEAIQHLQKIDRNSAFAAEARLQEAKLTFLIMRKPARAEFLLREAQALDPNSLQASYLHWKILDLTGRHTQSGDSFWRAYELSPEDQRPDILREWFMAEFYPERANQQHYNIFGARELGSVPASVGLIVILRESEPEAGFLHAALAAYYLEKGQPETSLEILREATDLRKAMTDQFFVAVLFEALVEMGEMEKARTCFAQFPDPHSGYFFWRSEGLYRQRVVLDAVAAADSYRKCLDTWPAKFDWRLMNRYSECLRKTGDREAADAMQDRVKYLTTDVLATEKTSRIVQALSNLSDPFVASTVRDLYDEFELKREAAAWEELHRKLAGSDESSNPSNGQ